jgi:hypothetical protein
LAFVVSEIFKLESRYRNFYLFIDFAFIDKYRFDQITHYRNFILVKYFIAMIYYLVSLLISIDLIVLYF